MNSNNLPCIHSVWCGSNGRFSIIFTQVCRAGRSSRFPHPPILTLRPRQVPARAMTHVGQIRPPSSLHLPRPARTRSRKLVPSRSAAGPRQSVGAETASLVRARSPRSPPLRRSRGPVPGAALLRQHPVPARGVLKTGDVLAGAAARPTGTPSASRGEGDRVPVAPSSSTHGVPGSNLVTSSLLIRRHHWS